MEIDGDLLKNIKETMKQRDELYSPFATKNSNYIRRNNYKLEEPCIRPPFFRDLDRIIHSKAFSRYIDKTQVFLLVNNDHVTHRVLHVQLVSKIARTIGRALNLNEDLIEAISLGHDIGHVPYGHKGEEILRQICIEHGIGPFYHNIQSVQFLDKIEDCDLTLQVLDGILCHNGEAHNKKLLPTGRADWGDYNLKIEKIKIGKGDDVFPLTLEGCVVRIADNIAYLGRDLKDAIEVHLIDNKLPDFPERCRDFFKYKTGDDINWLIVDTLIKDVINDSYDKNYISFSDDASECVRECKEFNMNKIYNNEILLKEDDKIKNMFTTIFCHFIEDVDNENHNSLIYQDMIDLNWISDEYNDEVTTAELVRDYIAGMTDRYFESVFNKITIPERVDRYYDNE
jgi:dGTPase